MAYPNPGLLKAAMGHYLTESARTALEALEPDEDVIEMGPKKQMPTVGPNQLLDMPLFTKLPFLPGSNTMFYRTNLGEKLYQPTATFDLNDPYCKVMAPRYKSLHDPHLRAYYKRKDNLRRLKKAGHITDKNKVVCTLKEFNEYRQYLTSLKMEFEKHYIREQKMLEKQVTRLQDTQHIPEAADTSKYREWLLKEERPTKQEQERVMRNRYLELINQELAKLEHLAEENRRLSLAQDDKKQQGTEKRKQLLLRKKMEEEWRKKEMMLLMKIGNDVKREARIDEQRQKSKEDKLRRKQVILEKKMAYHLRKLEEKFQKEGLLPTDRLFPTAALEQGLLAKKLGPMGKGSMEAPRKSTEMVGRNSTGFLDNKGAELRKGGSTTQPAQPASQVCLSKAKSSTKQSRTTLNVAPTSETASELIPSKSATSLEQETVLSERDMSKKGTLDSEPAGESLLPRGSSSKVSFTSTKDAVSMGSSAGSNHGPPAEPASSIAGSTDGKVAASASGAFMSNEGAPTSCGNVAGCGSKTSCCGSTGCGSKTSCCGSAGCGSKTSCCGSAGCGSKTSCCGSAGCGSKTSCCGCAGCGSKTSCCGSTGCGSKTSCCGSAGCGSKTSCCGSGGCCSNNGKSHCCASGGCGSTNSKATGGYDSSGSSKHGANSCTSKLPFLSSAGVNPSDRGPLKPSTKATVFSTASRHTVNESSGRVKQKKRATLMFCQSELDNPPKGRSSSKKKRVDKAEHMASTSQDNEDSEPSYSSYLHHLLSTSDHSAIRDSLKGKVSAFELNSIIQNIMTWVVSAVTSILYPALTKFEERVRTRVYTISEESVLSSDNSSSCSSCNEDLYEAYRNFPSSSARKVSFTDTSIKPTASSPSEFHTTSGKPTSLLSSKSSYTSFSKSTPMSVDSDIFKGKFKRGKTAIFFSPSKHSGLLSTTASMRTSKSDSYIFQMQKAASNVLEKAVTSCHSKRKSMVPRIPLSKADTTHTTTTDTEGMPFAGGEHKPLHASADQREGVDLKDLKSIFADLKSPLTKITSIILDDIFKRILGDLGFMVSSVSISMEVLLESISESLLGSHPTGSPVAGSVSRIASFVASDLVENVLNKLHSTAQKKYFETISRDDFATECKALCMVAAGKHAFPDPPFWRALMPLSLESIYRIAEEIIQLIVDKLQVFSTLSQTKVSQFELCVKIKALGIPLEQLYRAIPLHTVESEAANAIVKDTIRKIISKTVASSETNILQYVEEMISSILGYIQRQMSPKGAVPTRESSILLQLINDVFNDLSTEKLWGVSAAAKSRASQKNDGELPNQDVCTAPETKAMTMTTLFTADQMVRTPFPLVNVPGMVIYSETEGKEKKEADGTLSSVNREQKVLVMGEGQDKVRYESFGLESQQRSRPHPKSALQGDQGFLDQDRKKGPEGLEKTDRHLENPVPDAVFSSLEAQQTTTVEWTLEQTLKKMEEDFKEQEKSPIVQLVRNFLNEMFRHVWAEQPIWPPRTPPSSLAHVSMNRQQADEGPRAKGQAELSGQGPVSDADVHALVGDLVKTAFQKISHATQTDSQDITRRHSSLVITDILPLNMPTEATKSPPAVHFRDPEMSFQSVPEATQPPTNVTEDPAKTNQQEHNLPSAKSELANDLVQTFVAKLETFVTSKIESQLCVDVRNLKTSISSDFSSAVQKEFKRILENQCCLEDIFNSYNNSILAEKEKTEPTLPLPHLHLKSHAQEVARMMLKSLKHGLDKEMEAILVPPVIFSESIAASQIINMVLTIFVPPENLSESQRPSSRKQSVLEKLFRKNTAYKKDIQFQIQNTVELFLNEIYQTIILEMGSSLPEELHTPGREASRVPKAADGNSRKAPSGPAVAKSDASLVSCELVDIVLEDLSSGLAAGLNTKGTLSARFQSLLYDLVQGTVQPLAQLISQGTKAGKRGHSLDTPSLSKVEQSRKMARCGMKLLPDLKDFSPEGITKYLVDNILLRLEMFAEEKLESELALAAQQEKEHQAEGRYAAPTPGVGLDRLAVHGQQAAGTQAGSYRDKAKLAVRASQSNLKLCAEKLTCTILKVIQEDLEREMLSCQNIVPYEENASANEIMNDLLKILAVQIALTENEVQKRVLKRIFQRQPAGHMGGFPLIAKVEDVLSQVTQRILGDLGQLPSFNNESLFLSSESKSSSYNGMTETVSQANSVGVAGEIVEGVLNKMYSVIVGTLFSSSGSKSELDSLSSNKLSTEAPCLIGKSDLQKLTLALSQLQPPPRSLGEELVQNVLNKIACFAASNLEEALPSCMQQKRKPHALLQYEIQGMGGTLHRPRLFSDSSESSLMRVSLSKSDLTVYAKDVVSKVLGTIIDGFKMEDYHRTTLRVNTLSSEQISVASDLVHSVVHDLHTDDIQVSHLHKHTSMRHGKMDGLPSAQMYFQFELSTKDARGKPKGLFYEDFSSYLKQVLPRDGILREIFEQQPLSDATINESLEMLQVAESIVSEVFMRTRDLEASVCTLRKIPGEVSERLFCYGFKRADAPTLFHSDSQAEIGSTARDIVASVFENVHKCLACSVPATHEKDGFPGKKNQAFPKGSGKTLKHRFTQPEFPFYNVSLKSAMDTIDKIAKETVECVVLMLETFVARHFRRDFKCNFLEIVKFPLESLSFAQLTRSLDSLLTQVGNVAETTVESFRSKLQGPTGKEALPTLGSTHNFLDFSKLGSAITRECIETSIQQVQMLHSELNVYANNAVSGILEIIKRTLDRELTQKEATLFSSSSESLVLSETISVMLDRCNESLTEITSELMVENLQWEMSGQAFVKDRGLARDLAASPWMRTTSQKYRRVDLRDRFPPINVPGMVIYSEEETEVQEETPSQFPSVFKYSERGSRAMPERHRGPLCSTPAPKPKPPARRGQNRALKTFRPGVLEDESLPRQSSIPEGSILEKLFRKIEEPDAIPRLHWTGHLRKAGLLPHHEPLTRSPLLGVPEHFCLSALCPLKLGHTAETIVDTLLGEFGLENETTVQGGCCEEFKRHFSPLMESPHLGTSGSFAFPGPKLERHSLLSRWEGRRSTSSEQTDTTTGESGLLVRAGSSLLSKWESKQYIFRCKSPDFHKDLELLACSHVPDPCEIQLLANHIVLSVVKELIVFQSREALDEKACRISLPAWKQELIQSESRWLQERIWRCTYLPPCRKQSSCLDVFWEPLTQAVISRVLLRVSNSSAQNNMRESSGLFDNSFSMFCSVDPCCPAHGLSSPQSPPLNIEELAFRLSEVIVGILCEQNVLQESMNRKGFRGRKTKCIYVPPLCLADFDDVYHPLVKEVSDLLSTEIEIKGRYASHGKTGDIFSQQQCISSPRISRASRGDCRGPGDVKRLTCLSTMGPVAHKTQKLSCIASNLDNFIRSLKTRESKHLVNKVLHIILDSLWSDQPQSSFAGPFSNARSQNAVRYQDLDLPAKRHLLHSSMCPHAYRLSSNMTRGDLGLSPKSVVLLDVVSEKLIRTLLDKCLTTEHLTGTFMFDESPEDEQFYDEQNCTCNEDELIQYSRRGLKANEAESSTSVFTYDIKYAEEPWAEAQSGVSSYESALDNLAHTLVKPVMTELSLSLECPGYMKPFSKKAVGFTQPTSRKVHGQSLGRKHGRSGKADGYSSFPRGKKQEPKGPIPGRRQPQRSLRERNNTVLETAVQRRAFHSRPAAPVGRSATRKPQSATYTKKTYRREVVTMMGHGDQPGFATVYSALFLEEVISLLLIKIFSSLCSRHGRDFSVNLHEMNSLFVNALVEEFKKAGIGILQRAEQKVYFPLVDSRTVNKIADSILREFGFQLAADGSIGRDIKSLAERAADIILTEILDYQLPPPVCRRLPQSAYKNVQAGPIIQRIEHCVCFPKVPKFRQSPPAYVTILSQKYLERVINQLLAQLFPPSEDLSQKQDKRKMPGADFDELSSYMITEVMKSIAKHKIWVAKKDYRCQLHSEKELQGMVDSIYKNVLTRSGSQTSIQEDVKCRNAALVDHITSFIIQEVTKHHLQTFLSKDETPSGSPDPEVLSENIVRTVLDSIRGPSASQADVFPAKFLEEIVSRVLSKIFGVSMGKKEAGKGQCEAELGKVAKRLASSISLQFGRASVTGTPNRGGQSLGAPLADVMDDVVDSVCRNISRERGNIPEEDLGRARDSAVLGNIKRLVEKGISDYLLHPLFSGDLSKDSLSPTFHEEDAAENVRAESEETQEAKESWSPFSTLLSSGFLKDLITGLLSKIFPSTPPRDAESPWGKRLPSESDLSALSTQLLDDVRMKLLKHEIRVTKDAHPEQCEYSEEDVQNMTDSLCSKIIQRSGSLEAVQREVRSKSHDLIDRIAGFLVGDILQKHVQPFVSAGDPPAWDRAAAGDSRGGMEMHQAAVQPLGFRQAAQEKEAGKPTPSILGEIISELLSKISNTFLDTPLSPSGDSVGDTAVQLARSLTKGLARARLSVQEGPEEQLGSAPDDRPWTGWRMPHKDAKPGDLFGEDVEDERDTSPPQTATLVFEEAMDHLLESACPPRAARATCLIQEKLMADPGGSKTKPSGPYVTVISYPVIEAIIDRLLSRVFPSSSSTGQGEGALGSKQCNKIALIKEDIMTVVLKQAIWASTYGNKQETGISEEAMEKMVESVYCDVLHEVLLQQPFPEDKESLSNLYVTQIACFIINEMFKYHLQPLTSEGAPPHMGTGARDLPDSCVTVFPCRLLEDMLHQLLEKIFPTPESVAAYIGKQLDFSEMDFTEMAANLKSYVVTEISAHQIQLENTSKRIPDMDQETEEDIANSVYNQILQRHQSQGDLQNTLMEEGKGTVYDMANLLIREILNFHLHPFLCGSDSPNRECTKWQKKRQPSSPRIYSALFLEDVVVAFFCKILSSPNISAYSKEGSVSEHELKDLVIELVNALVTEFKISEVQVIQSAEEYSPFPQIGAEEVIHISNSIYEKLLEQVGSELEIFKAFQNNNQILAEKLAPLITKEISGYQFLPLFTGDTSPYLFSFLEAETIVDRVETILPEPSSSGSVFGEMFVKILHRIFPSWAPSSSSEPCDSPMAEGARRNLPMVHSKEEKGPGADKSIKNLVENIYKTVYGKSVSPNRKGESSPEEVMGFISKTRQDYPVPTPCSPPDRSCPSTLASKSTGWTIHHVKLGEGELQTTQVEEGADVYSSSFLKDIFSGLVTKLLSSTTSMCMPEKKGSDVESSAKHLVESILKEFAKSPVKVLQIPEGGQTFPAVGKAEVAKIIHASLCSIMLDRGSGAPICTDKGSDHRLAERLASAIKKEIFSYQIQGTSAKACQGPALKPFEFGEMAKKVLMEVKKTNTPSQTVTPYPLLVSQRFIHDVLAVLLARFLPLPTAATAPADTEDQCAEFDFIHMKLLSKVMSEIAKDKDTKVQYLDRVQPNRVVSQTVANSIYSSLLPEFGTTTAVEKCIKAGCTILLERIADFVIKEISGNQMQTYFTEELNRQQEAEKAERDLGDQCSSGPGPLEEETPLHSHLRGLSSIFIEEVAAKLLSKMFHSLPLEDMDTGTIASMKEVAKKIINSLQRHLSKNKLKVWQQADVEDLGSEDSQAVGEVVDSVYTDILRHSSSEASLYEDITNKNEDFVNRVACFMVSEISKRDFQSLSDSDDELRSPSVMIKLESEKIVKKFLSDMELGETKDNLSGVQIPLVPVLFLEEILSRFLTTILLAQYDLGIHGRKSLSKTSVNEIVGLLKTSVEKEMSKNKISLIASDDKPILDPQYEEKVNQVVHSVISNVLEKSGSQKELYNDMTTSQVIFPEQVASIIINEISSFTAGKPLDETSENETFSALELDRIVSKVLARVSSHMEVEEGEDVFQLSSLPETREESTPDDLLLTEDIPVKIVPYIGNKPLKINPDIIADHLAVLSIKTEPLEKLKKTCLSKTGMSLTELRRASATGKSLSNELPFVEDHKKKERRPSLDMAGRLGVKPREAVCRNSFQSLMKPDITKVELLKDVESKEDLIVRLITHDIENQAQPGHLLGDSDEEEQVLTEHTSLYFEVPNVPRRESSRSSHHPSEPHLPKAASGVSQKKSTFSSKGRLTLTLSGSSVGPGPQKGKQEPPPPPRMEVTSLSTASRIHMAAHEASTPSSSATPTPGSTPKATSRTSAEPVRAAESCKKEDSLGKAVVGMHLSRDTEETSGHFEITSVYQDKKIKETLSEDHPGEDCGKVIATTTSEAHVPLRRRSSVVQKVSSALSRVFSRTSASNLPAGPEKTTGDHT